LLPAGLDAERSRLDGEALALRGVDMGSRDGPVRLDDDLDHDRLAVGVSRGGEEGDALAGDRVVDCVACVDHLAPPSASWLTPGCSIRGCRKSSAASRIWPRQAGRSWSGATPPRGGLPLARLDEARLVGEHDRLHAVAQVELR